MLLSFEKIEGIKNISTDLQKIDESRAPKPLRAHLRNDNCLFIWRRLETLYTVLSKFQREKFQAINIR